MLNMSNLVDVNNPGYSGDKNKNKHHTYICGFFQINVTKYTLNVLNFKVYQHQSEPRNQ